MLVQPVPPYPALRRVPRTGQNAVLNDWELLRAWRDRPPWLALALHLTVPPAGAQT
jgi:hypothetical protein